MIRSAAATSCFLGALLLVSSAVAYAEDDDVPENLPALSAASGHASVVGVSSGGYMATQLAVAWPERFSGVGVLAAGPWGCAQGALSLALNQCMNTRRGVPSLETLDHRRERYESLEQVGERGGLAQLRAYIWHGEEDDTVSPELGSLLAEQWQRWLASSEQVRFVRSESTGHGWPIKLPKQSNTSPQSLGGCRQGGGSHVLACDEDVADDMLSWLYPERPSSLSSGALVAFDQSEFDETGLADTGYVFIPEACEAGGCPVAVALHGCQMSVDAIGDTFIRHSGLNRWAEENGQVVLYPQAESSMANPQGCWDWWGFAESTWQINPLHDTRDGTQVSALMSMLDRLESEPVEASEPARQE